MRVEAGSSSSSLSWLAVAAETFLLSSAAALCLQFVPLLRLHNGRSNVAANGAWNIMKHYYEARDWCCIVDQLFVCVCVCVCASDSSLLKRYLLTSCPLSVGKPAAARNCQLLHAIWIGNHHAFIALPQRMNSSQTGGKWFWRLKWMEWDFSNNFLETMSLWSCVKDLPSFLGFF
jgi:hypothetical protein